MKILRRGRVSVIALKVFLTCVVMSEWPHPPQEGRYPQEGSILLCYKWHRGVLRHSGQPSTSR